MAMRSRLGRSRRESRRALLRWLCKEREVQGCFKGEIDVGIELDVDIDRSFGCFKGGFKVGSGTVSCYRSSHGTDVDNSEIANPA